MKEKTERKYINYTYKNIKLQTMEIDSSIKELSDIGLISLLQSKDWIVLDKETTRIEAEKILQLNINDDLIDEIEVITILSGE